MTDHFEDAAAYAIELGPELGSGARREDEAARHLTYMAGLLRGGGGRDKFSPHPDRRIEDEARAQLARIEELSVAVPVSNEQRAAAPFKFEDEQKPDRCPAHGRERCPECSRISAQGRTDDGQSCRGCEYWGATGMHWDTCPYRDRGAVQNLQQIRAQRDELLAAAERFLHEPGGPQDENLLEVVERVRSEIGH